MSSEPALRQLKVEDAAACVTLAGRVGWAHSTTTWKQNIRWGGETAFCLTVEDRIVTTAIAIRYAERLAWVGVVITDPEYQGRGFAGRLMTVVMERLGNDGIQSVMLDASEKGYPVYQKLGFRDVYPMEVWAGSPTPTSPVSKPVLEKTDFDRVVALDTRFMGIERRSVLHDLWQPNHAWVDQENGSISGYLLAQNDSRGVHIGPFYHQTADGADDLLSTALNTFAGQAVRMHIPQPNQAAHRLAEQHGLILSRVATRMVYGKEPPGNMAAQFGVAGFATG
jgi:GNAT superfamily N-acetyltransferase